MPRKDADADFVFPLPVAMEDEEKAIAEAVPEEQPTTRASVPLQFSNVLRSFLGSNFLSMPYAFAQTGILGGPLCVGLVAAMTTLGCYLLLKTKRHHSTEEEPLDTYGKVAGRTLGYWATAFVDLLIIFTQMGFCVGYLVFIATNLQTFFPSLDVWLTFVIVAVFLLPLVLIPDIKRLAWTSTLSSIILFVGMVICITFFAPNWSIITEEPWIRWNNLVITLGLVTAAFEGIGLVIPVEQSINRTFTNRPYDRMLGVALTTATIILTLFGYGGYLTFGVNTDAVLTVNLHTDKWIGDILAWSFTSAIFFTYPLQMFPAVQTVEVHLTKSFPGSFFRTIYFSMILRTAMVTITAMIGYFIPWYGLIGSIVGSLGSSVLMYILPACFYICDTRKCSPIMVIPIFMFIFGAMLFVVGGWLSIKEVVEVTL